MKPSLPPLIWEPVEDSNQEAIRRVYTMLLQEPGTSPEDGDNSI